MILSYINPYSGKTFLSFFSELFLRLWLFLSGKLGAEALVSDEVQILVLCGVAGSAGILGCFLVLRKMTMLANAISHTILVGIVIAYAVSAYLLGGVQHFGALSLPTFLLASLGMGLLTTFLTEMLTRWMALQEDASIGIVFSFLFALGLMLTTVWTRNAHIGTEVVMGNIDALGRSDCLPVYLVLILNVLVVTLLYKPFLVTTFDQNYARTIGFSPALYHYLLMVLVSATAIASFRAVGVLMVLALLTGPVLIANLFTHRLKILILISMAVGMVCSIAGVAVSRHILTVYQAPLSTAGIVVSLVGFLLASILAVRCFAMHRIGKG